MAVQKGRVRGQSPDVSVWDEVAERQSRARATVAFEWQDCLLARPGPGIAYVDAPRAAWSPLAERVRAAFDPEKVLA